MTSSNAAITRHIAISLCTLLNLVYCTIFAVTITVDEQTKLQTIDGFGGSIMAWIPENKSIEWAKFCTRELGVSILRCDLHPQIIGKFENQHSFVDDIATNMSFMNSKASEIEIGFTAAENFYTNRLDEMKIMVSVWTQPHWMKIGAEDCHPDQWNRYTMGGTLPYTDDGREQNARYLTAAIKKIETDYNIAIYGISPQNELDWWHACETYTESCKKYYSGDPEGPGFCTWIPETKRLRKELDAKGMEHVKIIGPEHGTFGPGEWNAWQQMKYVRDIYNDTAMLNILDIWAVHSYGVPNSPDLLGRTNWSWLWDGYNGDNPELQWNGYKDYGKPSWQTECEAGDGTWNRGAMVLANRIQDALVAGHVSAFIPWAMGTPDPGVYDVTSTAPPYSLPKTFAFKHFSRYIRPGAVRLNTTPDNPSGITVSAFIHKTQGTLTIVLINNGSTEVADIALPSSAADISSFDVLTSTSTSSWVKSSTTAENAHISVSVPKSGIVTIYGSGNAATHRMLPSSAPFQKQNSAARKVSLFYADRMSSESIGRSARFYSVRGDYLGTFGDLRGKKNRSVATGVYIVPVQD